MKTSSNDASTVSREKAEAASEFMKQLANPNRLMIVCALIEGERSVGDLEAALGIRQPSLSQQLAELRDNGIVEARREARQVFYLLVDLRAVVLIAALHQIFCGSASDEWKILPVSPVVPEAQQRPLEAAMFARVALMSKAS